MEPETRNARLGDDRIAYQVVGDGPVDLVMSRGSFSTLDATWSMIDTSAPYLRLASDCRLILFDRLGTGWFVDRGSHHLKGVEGEWQLFALAALSETGYPGKSALHGHVGCQHRHENPGGSNENPQRIGLDQ